MNTHYRNNLEAVMQVNKTYTDKEIKKSEERILSIVARNNVDFIDHINEPTYKVTVPQNAKLLQLQAIGGNAVKYNPSVASDSTKAMIKTMPSTVYDFDCNKIYGASEVSENLYDINNIIQKSNNISTNGTEITFAPTNYTQIFKVGLDLNDTTNTYTYTFEAKSDIDGSGMTSDLQPDTSSGLGIDKNITLTTSWQTFTYTGTLSVPVVALRFFRISNHPNCDTANVYIRNVMFVKGSSAPASYIPYYSDIHNLELSGLKVENSNKWDEDFEIGSIDISTGQNITSSATCRCKNYQSVLPNTTYILNYVYRAFFYDSNKNYLGYVGLTNTSGNGATFTTPYNCAYVRFNFVSEYGTTYLNNIRLNLGTTLLDYVPYITPTTKTIDLSTIVDSNNNKLFPNGKLMGNENVKDVLGVYNQESKWDEVDIGLQTIEATGIDTHTFKITLSSAKAPSDNDKLANLLMANYETVTYNSISTSGNMTMALRSDNVFVIRNNAYSTAEAFKTAMSGVMLQFERNTYLTSNTDLSATLRNIQGYPNGSIIAENTHNMDVESVITYNSIIQETLCPSVTVNSMNAWDEEWEVGGYNDSTGAKTGDNSKIRAKNYNPCLPSTTYYGIAYGETGGGIYINILFYDKDKNFISKTIIGGSTVTTPSNAYYFTFYMQNAYGTTYKNNICINVSNANLNGTYKPYKNDTRNLPTQASDGWSAGTQRNYRVFCDDEGNDVSKRENNVNKNNNLGSLNYTYNADNYQIFASGTETQQQLGFKAQTQTLSKLYTYATTFSSFTTTDKCIYLSTDGNLYARDSYYNDATIFKTSLANEPLYYELADTSKTETPMDDFDFFFDVEEGDVITFNNPYAQQVYATYSFLIKEAKSNE